MKLPRFYYEGVFADLEEYICGFPHTELRYGKGQRMFSDLQIRVDQKFYYYIKSGRTVVIGTTDNDDRKLLCIYGRASFPPIDTTQDFYNIYQIVHNETMEDTCVLLFGYDTILEMIRGSSEFALRAINHAAEMLAQMTYQSVALPLLQAEERLCDFLYLCIMHVTDRPQPYIVRVPQVQMAQYIGVSRTHVTRVIGELRQRGVIRTGRRYLEVLDLDKLRESCSSTFQR